MEPYEPLLAETFGLAYIGAMVSLALYGFTTLQTYLYFSYYPNDNGRLKIFVATLWILETLHIIFVNQFLYIYLIINFGEPLALLRGHWTLRTSVLLNVIIAAFVQIFFTTRIHLLSKNYILSGVLGFFILAHIAFGIETVVRIFERTLFTELRKIKFNSAVPLSISTVVPDVLISASLCYYLKSKKDGTYAASVAELVLLLVLPNSFAYMAVDFCLGKLFANALLATLNTRNYIRGIGSDIVMSDFDAAKIESGIGGQDFTSNSHRGSSLQVRISRIPEGGFSESQRSDKSGPIFLDVSGALNSKDLKERPASAHFIV
ncbi:hypothetical protein SCHPADRAFT_940681 [Schizopora paradoxa]|uniref:DUF6534 domain-containing protein n=1 Tax=Schizopora paradoxa TaxID=27342 RepID=A0A0H2RMK9_9AGAM|nr:hypothetical protein SCHPADRAFT_940681 [Schizopora paradoxa]